MAPMGWEAEWSLLGGHSKRADVRSADTIYSYAPNRRPQRLMRSIESARRLQTKQNNAYRIP